MTDTDRMHIFVMVIFVLLFYFHYDIFAVLVGLSLKPPNRRDYRIPAGYAESLAEAFGPLRASVACFLQLLPTPAYPTTPHVLGSHCPPGNDDAALVRPSPRRCRRRSAGGVQVVVLVDAFVVRFPQCGGHLTGRHA